MIIIEVQGKSQEFHGTHTTPIKAIRDDKYGKSARSYWVRAFVWRLRSRFRAPSTSQLVEKMDVTLP